MPVVADGDPDAARRRVEYTGAEVPRRVEPDLVEAGGLDGVDHPRLSDERAVGVDHGAAVVGVVPDTFE